MSMPKDKPESDKHLPECRCPWCERREAPESLTAYLIERQGTAMGAGIRESGYRAPDPRQKRGNQI